MYMRPLILLEKEDIASLKRITNDKKINKIKTTLSFRAKTGGHFTASWGTRARFRAAAR